MNTLPLKLTFKDETRRRSVVETTSFVEIEQIVKETFLFPSLESFSIQYKDEEGSVITVRSQIEFEEAKRVASVVRGSALHFFVVERKPSTSNVPIVWSLETPSDSELPPPYFMRRCHRFRRNPSPLSQCVTVPPSDVNEEKKEEDLPLHPNIICDGCDKQLRGTRFQCLDCHNFDLCSNCKAKSEEGAVFLSHLSSHKMKEIQKPQPIIPRPNPRYGIRRGIRFPIQRFPTVTTTQRSNSPQEVVKEKGEEKQEEIQQETNQQEPKKEIKEGVKEEVKQEIKEDKEEVKEERKEEAKEEVKEKTESEKIKEGLQALKEMGLVANIEFIRTFKKSGFNLQAALDAYLA